MNTPHTTRPTLLSLRILFTGRCSATIRRKWRDFTSLRATLWLFVLTASAGNAQESRASESRNVGPPIQISRWADIVDIDDTDADDLTTKDSAGRTDWLPIDIVDRASGTRMRRAPSTNTRSPSPTSTVATFCSIDVVAVEAFRTWHAAHFVAGVPKSEQDFSRVADSPALVTYYEMLGYCQHYGLRPIRSTELSIIAGSSVKYRPLTSHHPESVRTLTSRRRVGDTFLDAASGVDDLPCEREFVVGDGQNGAPIGPMIAIWPANRNSVRDGAAIEFMRLDSTSIPVALAYFRVAVGAHGPKTLVDTDLTVAHGRSVRTRFWNQSTFPDGFVRVGADSQSKALVAAKYSHLASGLTFQEVRINSSHSIDRIPEGRTVLLCTNSVSRDDCWRALSHVKADLGRTEFAGSRFAYGSLVERVVVDASVHVDLPTHREARLIAQAVSDMRVAASSVAAAVPYPAVERILCKRSTARLDALGLELDPIALEMDNSPVAVFPTVRIPCAAQNEIGQDLSWLLPEQKLWNLGCILILCE